MAAEARKNGVMWVRKKHGDGVVTADDIKATAPPHPGKFDYDVQGIEWREFRALDDRLVLSLFLESLVALLLVGCQYDPWANRFLTAQASENDIVGTYTIDADSEKRQNTLPMSASARIVLSSDHKAEFAQVPEEFQGPCSVTGRGSWSLGKNDKYTVVRARIYNEDQTSPCKGEVGYELMLFGKVPPYKLHITLGDPDSGDAVQFKKEH